MARKKRVKFPLVFLKKFKKIQISLRKGNGKCILLVDSVLCTVLHFLDMQGGRIHGEQSRVQLLSKLWPVPVAVPSAVSPVNTRPVSETLFLESQLQTWLLLR